MWFMNAEYMRLVVGAGDCSTVLRPSRIFEQRAASQLCPCKKIEGQRFVIALDLSLNFIVGERILSVCAGSGA